MITQFLLDGEAYNVNVMSLKRLFEVKDTTSSVKMTQSGRIYRNPVGTYYNYQMTVRQRGSDRESLDAFWDAISQPVESHLCVFPYNQTILSQKMYVKTGSQDIVRLHDDGAEWRDITIQFLATTPAVMP